MSYSVNIQISNKVTDLGSKSISYIDNFLSDIALTSSQFARQYAPLGKFGRLKNPSNYVYKNISKSEKQVQISAFNTSYKKYSYSYASTVEGEPIGKRNDFFVRKGIAPRQFTYRGIMSTMSIQEQISDNNFKRIMR